MKRMSLIIKGNSVIRAAKRLSFIKDSPWNTNQDDLEELIDELILKYEKNSHQITLLFDLSKLYLGIIISLLISVVYLLTKG
jgi:hypothetical protein